MNQFLDLPRPVKGILAVTTCGTVVGFFYIIASLTFKVLLVIGLGLVGVALALGVYLLVLRVIRKRKGKLMNAALNQHNSGAPTSVSSAGERARIDELRQKFNEGIEVFKSLGKDVYSLPWFLVVGEPGSGKTESIRRSKIGFPPALENELQGVGGTINMNWWFTNHGVLLDTAGRIMFEGVKAGSNSEWKTFLELMRKMRPDCPINGLLLMIPIDTLIKDSPEEIESKARTIATQFDQIQRSLDVRFPVFVLVTKCDLIPGFREFFEHVSDPDLQQQIMGWSNPEDLDTPFQSDQLKKHLNSVVDLLKKRRMGMMQDPVALNPGGKRINEVDVMYKFPNELANVFPALQSYLETIFVAGEWSQKPLFLRGIYFPSSMQEGAALDQELAKILNTSFDELPFGAWERERSYFLRDLYADKIFKEKGLVTRASDTSKLLLRRKAILIASGLTALISIFFLSWYGSNSLRRAVGNQLEYWQYAADPMRFGSSNPRVPTIVYGHENAFYYVEEDAVDMVTKVLPLSTFHQNFMELVDNDVKIPLIFRLFGLGFGTNEGRQEAQRVLFENSVVKPLVDSTREKLVQSEEEQWTADETRALSRLIQIESAVARKELRISDEGQEDGSFIPYFVKYLTGEEPTSDVYPKIWNSIYFGERRGAKNQWPPLWLSGGRTMRENRAIRIGLEHFFAYARNSQEQNKEGVDSIGRLYDLFNDLEAQEAELVESAKNLDLAMDDPKFKAAFEAYEISVKTAGEAIDQVKAEDWFTFDWLLLHPSYVTLIEESQKSIDRAFSSILTSAALVPADEEIGSKAEKYPIFIEIKRKVTAEKALLNQSLSSSFPKEKVYQLKLFDEKFFQKTDFLSYTEPVYAVRAHYYQACRYELGTLLEPDAVPAGLLGDIFERGDAIVARLNEELDAYSASYGPEFKGACREILRRSHLDFIASFGNSYRDYLGRLFSQELAFPLVLNSPNDGLDETKLKEMSAALRNIKNDLSPKNLERFSPDLRADLQDVRKRLEAIDLILDKIVDRDGNALTVKVRVIDWDEQKRLFEASEAGENNYFGNIFAGNIYKSLSFNGSSRILATQREDTLLADELSLAEHTLGFFFYLNPDATEVSQEIVFSGHYMPLRLVLGQGDGKPLPKAETIDDGKTWYLNLNVPDQAGDPKPFTISIEFNQSLPLLQDWPDYEAIVLPEKN